MIWHVHKHDMISHYLQFSICLCNTSAAAMLIFSASCKFCRLVPKRTTYPIDVHCSPWNLPWIISKGSDWDALLTSLQAASPNDSAKKKCVTSASPADVYNILFCFLVISEVFEQSHKICVKTPCRFLLPSQMPPEKYSVPA